MDAFFQVCDSRIATLAVSSNDILDVKLLRRNDEIKAYCLVTEIQPFMQGICLAAAALVSNSMIAPQKTGLRSVSKWQVLLPVTTPEPGQRLLDF